MAKNKQQKSEMKPAPLPSPDEVAAQVRRDAMEDADLLKSTLEGRVVATDRKGRLDALVQEARSMAEGMGDETLVSSLDDLKATISGSHLDEAGFDDAEKYLREAIRDMKERAEAHLEASLLATEERGTLSHGDMAKPWRGSEVDNGRIPTRDAMMRLLAPSGAGIPLKPVAAAVENLEKVAGVERGGAAQAVADEKAAVEKLRGIARPGEPLVEAVERLEALANRAAELEAEVRRLSLDKGVLLGAQEKAMESLSEAEGLRAMVGGDLKRRAVGVIVEDVEKERHVVHVFERGGGALSVWAYNKGERMPWHAAREVVAKLVETRVTPEDKR